MTGYGRGEAVRSGLHFEAEVSSVNRRQLDVVPQLPREAALHEGLVRRLVAAHATRGRVTVKLRIAHEAGSGRRLQVDQALLDEYRRVLGLLLGASPSLVVGDLLRMPGVVELVETEATPEAVEDGIQAATNVALDAWDAMRAEEGRHLRDDLESRLVAFQAELEGIEARAPIVPGTYRRQMIARLEQAGLPVDLGDDRIVREIGLFADRSDISEERVRLRSHLAKFRSVLEAGDPPGRPLDFLLQEMQREVNTIGSKANDAGIAQHVVAAKTELEKLREQVQNLE